MTSKASTRSAGIALILTAASLFGCRSEGVCSKHGVKTEVEGNHAHLLAIPAAAVERGSKHAFRIEGSEHEHAVLLNDEHFKKLANGERIEVLTSSVMAHTHNVIVQCKQ
ncbi:MAG TPA: hypothetical protein VHO25_23450 [Polyangiaceae bacterium]|nr:hypothetical protein [Polyangiaceae bacterium]